MLDHFMVQLGDEMQHMLEANEDGTYSLHLDEDLHVLLQQHSEHIISLYAPLTALPVDNIEPLLVQLMSANLFGSETGGALLGLDKEGQQVVLRDFLFEAQTYRTFYTKLEDFTNYAAVWRNEIAEYRISNGS